MPPWSWSWPPPPAGFFSGTVEMRASVVSSRVAYGFHCNSSTVAAAAAAAAAAETKRVADVTQGAPNLVP
jgi:hypothetical protein